MSQEFKGFVVRINVKEGRGKRGPWKAYSAKLEREDGTEYDEWLSLGFEAPSFKEGDFVKLNAAKDDRGYMKVDPDSVKVAKNPPARAKGEGKGGDSSRGNYSGGKGGVDWNSATARAIELAGLLLTHDALPISAQKGKAAEAKRYEEIVAAVDKLTVKLYNDSLSLRLLETVADTVDDKKPDGPLPDEQDEQAPQENDDDEDF